MKLVVAQRRDMHGVAAILEGGTDGSQVIRAATHAVDENNVLDVGHTTKDDDQRPDSGHNDKDRGRSRNVLVE
jgi:hypothetical protein